MDVSQDDVAFLRPYTPDILAWLAKFGEVTAYYDGNGHYARAQPAAANVFDYNTATNVLTGDYDSASPQFPVSTGSPPYVLDPINALPRRRLGAGARRLEPVPRQRWPSSSTRPTATSDRDPARPMRRLIAIASGLLLVAALVAATASGEGDDGGDYKVRAYFDNAGFLVNGEEVRIAGATVGTVDEVTVSLPGEPVTANGDEEPGKAVAVLNITDSGFQDFLTDASCLIRPQSLLGEKYVECEPTQPRAPGTRAAAGARADPRRRDRRRPVPAADREQRQADRPRPRQQHHPSARGRALPADPQRPRRRPRRPRPRPRRGDPSRRPGAQADRQGARRPSPSRTSSSPSSPATSDTILAAAGSRAAPALAGFIRNAADRRRPPRPSAATTSSPASTSSRTRSASSRARWSSCGASPSRRRRSPSTCARRRRA